MFHMRACVVLVVAWAGLSWGQQRPEVTLPQGTLRGLQATQYNFTYYMFLSVPFAEPPIGPLRFKDPVAAGPWDSVLDASQPPPSCVQLQSQQGMEDCLYLNIYTPVGALNAILPLPVMVFIHGGAFYGGSASEYQGTEELVDQDVIVVLIQYRLGVLGFLSTEDAAAPGNQGLKDQTLALKWVKDNIAYFGGDPSRITIFGESAGAASVHYQMLVPAAAGLFSGAILESGNALCPWARGRDFLKNAQAIAQSFGCPTEPSDALVSCLHTVDDKLLQDMQVQLSVWLNQPFIFGPYIEGADYIPGEPATLLHDGNYHHVPAIMGINRDEWSTQTVSMYAEPESIVSLTTNFSVNGPASLHLLADEDPVNTSYTAYNTYVGDLNINKQDCDNLTRLYSDCLFIVPLDWTVQETAGKSPLFVYELHHRGEHSVVDDIVNIAHLDLPQAKSYVAHGDDLQYLFNPWVNKLNTSEDIAVANIFITSWTNFAKYRTPTPDGSLGFVWELSNPVDLQHLKILPQPYMEADQRAEARAFWESLPLRINSLLNHTTIL